MTIRWRMTYPLQCPVCQMPLTLHRNQWQCENRHSFDQARQGYVNLHVVQHKHSKTPGDTVQSVAARQRFLAAGFYQPLQLAIMHTVQQLGLERVLDIGCGEGYYTRALAQVAPQVIGLDIAKTAIQTAAKSDGSKSVQWIVGTGAVLPVLDASMQLCCSFFSPLPKTEMLRVLDHTAAYLLIATPSAHHLHSLRAALFDTVNPHQPEKFLAQLAPEFSLQHNQLIETELNLPQATLQDLLTMTPYAYKAKADKRAALESVSDFVTQAAFCLYVLKKSTQPSIKT